ncbi:MAG: hypothetical protein A2622_06450 [Bdellovibrionales bacterium RIFCSPHIGHO2_01_FULL_40_29]|nr:MAG: hypothetical protein A2622_06450 [Bdellovibrionales bacterium RIFCSPHIGHO2_01_FULL_40_29]OFZ35083.1 MAG: hypothetical protein A3D17_06800 [Bdellovibrionales bacterium RIFCSPHIGHO2_02_FULL_40_15]
MFSSVTQLIVIFIFAFGLGAQAEQAPALIQVTSFAEVSMEPNIAVLQLEIWAKAGSAKPAQEVAARYFQKVKATIESFKIKKDDFVTTNYSVTPDYVYDQKTQQNRIVGFRVTQNLQISLRQAEKAGSLVDELIGAEKTDKSGVSIQSIGWDSDKKAAAETQAMSQAIKNAKKRAEDMATAAGVKIKGLYRLANSQSHVEPQQLRAAMKFSMTEAASDQTQLPAGTIKVRADVSADYLIQ